MLAYTTSSNDSFKRDLIIYSKLMDKNSFEKVIYHLNSNFQLVPIKKIMEMKNYIIVGMFKQENISASRKVLQPILENYFNKLQ